MCTRQAQLDRDLDLGTDQASADSKERGRLGLGGVHPSYCASCGAGRRR